MSIQKTAEALGLVKASVGVNTLQQRMTAAYPTLRLPRSTRNVGAVGSGVPQKGMRAVMRQTNDKSRTAAMTARMPGSDTPQNRSLLHNLKDKVISRRGNVSESLKQFQAPAAAQGKPLRLPTTGKGQRALNAVVHGHEGAEHGAAGLSRSAQAWSHIDPSVLVREHQILSNLSGAGAGQARTTMKDLRGLTGEAEGFEQAVKRVTGGRGDYHTFGGKKLPKALRKRVDAAWRAQTEGEGRQLVNSGRLDPGIAGILGYNR